MTDCNHIDTSPPNEGSRAEQRPFRFKHNAGAGKDNAAQHEDALLGSRKRDRRRHHSAHHRSKRRRNGGDDTNRHLPQNRSDGSLDPDRAFRESLFDALGDDEGAEFWHGVYGQPIHNYPNTYINEDSGELEQMNDEDYAQYVRRRMWEKSREGIEAEKEEQRKDKLKEEQQKKKQQRTSAPPNEAHNNFVFDFEIEASLRRGQRRKYNKRWQELWESYLKRCEELRNLADQHHKAQDSENLFLRNKIAWAVESGKRDDVNAEEIERFITEGVHAVEADKQQRHQAVLSALKQERVRWHPDKMLQRYGFMTIDEMTMQGITATFQALDKMWQELKKR